MSSTMYQATIDWILSWFRERPAEENDTMREIEERIVQEEKKKEELKIKLQQQLAAEEKKKEELLRKIKLQLAAEEKKKEKLSRKIKLQQQLAAEDRRQSEESKRKVESAVEEQRQSEEGKKENARDAKKVEEEVQRVKSEYQKREKGLETELQRLQKELEEKELELKEEMRKAKELTEKERQDQWPTREEYEKGRQRIEYSADNLHFAIVGKSGSGKSSLINSFLDYDSGHSSAARTGVTETTSEVSRYPDRGEQAPRSWTVWYDVPGAGTQDIPARQYFIHQGLFVFDIILIAIGDRFEETDVRLLRDCNRFKIPALIVRSKADMHIDNLVKAQGRWRQGVTIPEETIQRCRRKFITESKEMIRDELAKARIPGQEVYLVSSYALREVYNCSLDGSESDLPPDMIDEKKLIQDIMLLAIQRRGGDMAQAAVEAVMKGNQWARKTTQMGRNIGSIFQAPGLALNALLHRDHTEGADDGTAGQMDQSRQLDQDTSNIRPRSGGPNHSSQQRHQDCTGRVNDDIVVRVDQPRQPNQAQHQDCGERVGDGATRQMSQTWQPNQARHQDHSEHVRRQVREDNGATQQMGQPRQPSQVQHQDHREHVDDGATRQMGEQLQVRRQYREDDGATRQMGEQLQVRRQYREDYGATRQMGEQLQVRRQYREDDGATRQMGQTRQPNQARHHDYREHVRRQDREDNGATQQMGQLRQLSQVRRQDHREHVDDGATRQMGEQRQVRRQDRQGDGATWQMDQPQQPSQVRHQGRGERVDDGATRQMSEPWQPNQNTSNVRPESGRSNHSSQQRNITWIKHVIYLPKPVGLNQLQHELNAYNPNLSEMFAAQPRMLSPKTAVLNFLPGQQIPEEVTAFGRDIPFHPYRPRPEGTKKNTDSHRDAPPPYSNTQPASQRAEHKSKR